MYLLRVKYADGKLQNMHYALELVFLFNGRLDGQAGKWLCRIRDADRKNISDRRNKRCGGRFDPVILL